MSVGRGRVTAVTLREPCGLDPGMQLVVSWRQSGRRDGQLCLERLARHELTRICFNLGVRFLLTFAQNTHRITVFRLAQRTGSRPCSGSMGDYESWQVQEESNFLPV